MPPRAAPLYREWRENFTITLHHASLTHRRACCNF
jgi:hypothetical protein